jgi:lipoate-protein ligase A
LKAGLPISQHLKQPLTIGEFKSMIFKHIQDSHKDFIPYELSARDIKAVNELVRARYSTWEWNFGNSPAYNFANRRKFTGGNIEVYLTINNGIIEHTKIYGDFFGKSDITDIEQSLTGVQHDERAISQALSGLDMGNYISNIALSDFVSVFFR